MYALNSALLLGCYALCISSFAKFLVQEVSAVIIQIKFINANMLNIEMSVNQELKSHFVTICKTIASMFTEIDETRANVCDNKSTIYECIKLYLHSINNNTQSRLFVGASH